MAGGPAVFLAAVYSAGLVVAVAVLGWTRLAVAPAPRVGVSVDWHRFEALALEEGVAPLAAAGALPGLGVDGLTLRQATLGRLWKRGDVQLQWGWEWAARRRITALDGPRAIPRPGAASDFAGRLLVRAVDPELSAWLAGALARRWPYGAPAPVTLAGTTWFALPAPTPLPPDPALGDGPAGFPPGYLPDPPKVGTPGPGPVRRPRTDGTPRPPGEAPPGLRPKALTAWTADGGPLAALAGGYPEEALTVPLGFPPGVVERLAGLGLALSVRLDGHLPTATPADLEGLPRLPPETLAIFGRGALPAEPEAVAAAARRLAAAGYRVGVIWQEPVEGLDRLAAAGLPVVKVQPFWPGQRIEDTLTALRERQARLILYDDFEDLPGGATPGDPAGAPLRALAAALDGAGYGRGVPAALVARPAPGWAAAALAPAVWAAVALALAGSGVPRAGRLAVWLTAAGGAATAGLVLTAADPPAAFRLREALGLLVALAVPLLATLAALPHPAARRTNPWLVLVAATGLSLAGGLVVAALLADPVYVAQVRGFRGVRLSLLLPGVVAGGAVLAGRLPGAAALLAQPLRRASAGAALLLAMALALAGVRAGNFPAVGVSPWELRVRGLLERVLLVRPRTKEFLVGHPALVLAGAGGWGPAAAAALAVLVGLGQASVLNTFAHVQTPLGINLTRVLIGLAAGGLTGWLALVAWRRLPGGRAGPDEREAAHEPAPR